jgi:hypothetical protein
MISETLSVSCKQERVSEMLHFSSLRIFNSRSRVVKVTGLRSEETSTPAKMSGDAIATFLWNESSTPV